LVVDGPSGSGSDIVRVNCSRPIRVSAVGRGQGRQLGLHVPRQPAEADRAQGGVLPGEHPVLGLPRSRCWGRMGLCTGRARLVGEARYRPVRYRSVRVQLDSGQRGVRPRGKGTRAAAVRGFWAARDCLHGARVSGDQPSPCFRCTTGAWVACRFSARCASASAVSESSCRQYRPGPPPVVAGRELPLHPTEG
jgi:hypothetical protein